MKAIDQSEAENNVAVIFAILSTIAIAQKSQLTFKFSGEESVHGVDGVSIRVEINSKMEEIRFFNGKTEIPEDFFFQLCNKVLAN